MKWTPLQSEDQIQALHQQSFEHPVLVFKHSTRCSISATALSRFERNYTQAQPTNSIIPYYLDLIRFRPLSNRLAAEYEVEHQSPQVLVISEGRVVYTASHFDISATEALAKV